MSGGEFWTPPEQGGLTYSQGGELPPYEELVKRIEDLEKQKIERDRLPMSDITKWLESNWEIPPLQMIAQYNDKFVYDEIDGGADIAIPNGSVDTYLLKSNGTPVQVVMSVESMGEPWWIEGAILVKADSANETPTAARLFIDGNLKVKFHMDRSYNAGTAQFPGWRNLRPSRRITGLTPGNHVLQIAAICDSPFGGVIHRGDPLNMGYVAAWKVRP